MKLFASIGPLSAFTVLVVLCCEILIISLDLGHPFRVYRFLISANFSSMMSWMIIFTLAMVVIYGLECFLPLAGKLIILVPGRDPAGAQDLRHAGPGKNHLRRRRITSGTMTGCGSCPSSAFPSVLLFYGTNGAIFAVLLNRPIWNAMTPLLFVMTALLSGGALIAFLAYCLPV